jgi:two-component system sensor histidine kinase DesK
MRRDDGSERLPRLTAGAVLAISALLVVVEVWRIGELEPARDVAVAIVAALAFFPLHARHLRYGLRGERPPNSLPTLAVMAAIQLAALLAIGPAWSFMLAALATSALIVLPLRWALLAAALCALGPVLAHALHPGAVVANSDTVQYLVVSVVFRSVLQFALVWLVAATHELVASRAALATAAAERERTRIETDVRHALEQRANAIRTTAREARAALAGPGRAAVLISLDRVLVLSREALADVRRVVANARGDAPAAAADELARSARLARAPIRTANRIAWIPALAVQVVAIGYSLALVLGAWTIRAPEWGTLPSLAGSALCIAPYAAVAVAAARGGRTRFGPVLLLASALTCGTLLIVGNDLWGWVVWPFAATAALVLGDRWAPRVVAVTIAGSAAYMAVRYLDELLLLGPSFVGWFLLYMFSVGALAATALIASVRFVAVVAELDRTRDALAYEAATAERRRLSSDVHDVLGHSLTAISLKADLARRLLETDRAGAARELDELLVIADEQAGELDAVSTDARTVGFDAEAQAAIALLRSAGIEVHTRLEPGDLDAATSTALGFAVREASTNILRHARAQHAWIVASCEDGRARVEIVNDGASAMSHVPEPAAAAARGTGLAGIAERAAARGGFAETDTLPGGRFRLRVTLPLPVHA